MKPSNAQSGIALRTGAEIDGLRDAGHTAAAIQIGRAHV